MGLPYSKQINAAFDQVTPLVAAGFQVLQTTKNISLLLFAIQVLTVILLSLILAALFALLISVNPGLEKERDELVTPVVRGIAGGLVGVGRGFGVGVVVVAVGVGIGLGWGVWYTARDPTLRIEEGVDEDGTGERSGEDIEAIKKGESKQ